MSEFSPDGALLADAKLPSTDNSYRGFRMPWTGVPGDPPAIAAKRDGSGRATVYVSWNGATEVTHWQLHAGPNADALRPAGVIRRQGFETAIGLGTHAGRFAVTALDSAGRPLRRSGVVAI